MFVKENKPSLMESSFITILLNRPFYRSRQIACSDAKSVPGSASACPSCFVCQMFEQKNFKFTLKAVFPLIFSSMSSNSENKQIFSEIQPSNIRDMVKNQVSGDTTHVLQTTNSILY